MSGLFITRIYPFWLYQTKLKQTTTTRTNNFDKISEGKKEERKKLMKKFEKGVNRFTEASYRWKMRENFFCFIEYIVTQDEITA